MPGSTHGFHIGFICNVSAPLTSAARFYPHTIVTEHMRTE